MAQSLEYIYEAKMLQQKEELRLELIIDIYWYFFMFGLLDGVNSIKN